jgi:hypothetical protein
MLTALTHSQVFLIQLATTIQFGLQFVVVVAAAVVYAC